MSKSRASIVFNYQLFIIHFFEQIQEEAVNNENLRQAASANSVDDFRYVFNKALEGLIIDRMEGNEEIFAKLMQDSDFRKLASEHLLHQVYNNHKNSQAQPNHHTPH